MFWIISVSKFLFICFVALLSSIVILADAFLTFFLLFFCGSFLSFWFSCVHSFEFLFRLFGICFAHGLNRKIKKRGGVV